MAEERAILVRLLTEGRDGAPGWGAYGGDYDDTWRCSYCDSFGCNPYIQEEIDALQHADGCPVIAAKKLLEEH